MEIPPLKEIFGLRVCVWSQFFLDWKLHILVLDYDQNLENSLIFLIFDKKKPKSEKLNLHNQIIG